ncbi:hypothetical protein B0I35DRAFT_399658 [Stachybotrys elegans]|uniref:Zn(2)-C6 fungal-type domain-containing protein n=1 Tax=Stachybotrys elegans TaxID=80388 RepID=A0A8K0SEX1_9HYPO|nr:hypothetical protein B0I35DRAFT_399658 [Stachybotrys elegans]
MRPGKAPVSCVPCAKRKVRCDKQRPCCHCKRRPQDSCVYPVAAPENATHESLSLARRITELDRQIRNLGGDPDKNPQRTEAPPEQGLGNETDIGLEYNSSLEATETDDTYIEGPMWFSWQGIDDAEESIPTAYASGDSPLSSTTTTNYVSTILDPISLSNHSPTDGLAMTKDLIQVLWRTFLRNVHPFLKIFFAWEIEPLIQKARQDPITMLNTERALVTGILFMAATSLPEDELHAMTDEDRTALIDRLQRTLEHALHSIRYATTRSRLAIQAFILYITGIMDRADPAAVHSLLGIADRIAERMGLHHDGDKLGLTPLRSEERRRIWWQLKYMGIRNASRVGNFSATLSAKWDTKMPANLEDDDITAEMTSLPSERTNLTETSHALWSYCVLKHFRHEVHEPSVKRSILWILSQPTDIQEKQKVIDEMDHMLRSKFLQYCEPLDPLHINLQFSILQYLVALQRAIMQPAPVKVKITDLPNAKRDRFMRICVKNLDYCNKFSTRPELRGFLWHNGWYFPWVAFIYILLEAYYRFDQEDFSALWGLIDDTYKARPELSTTFHRGDIAFAARVTLATWKKRQVYLQKKHEETQPDVPGWMLVLSDTFEAPATHQPVARGEQEMARGVNDIFDAELFDVDMDGSTPDWLSWDNTFENFGFRA